MEITTQLVCHLIHSQFPQWDDLEIRPVAQSGNDNRTFHLGENMTVRLPSGPAYAAQVEKEAKWLPFLAPRLTLPISSPVAVGRPDAVYPFPWSVNRYIPGETLNRENVPDRIAFAADLSAFLRELQSIPTLGAPAAGAHNFYRGASPIVYHEETVRALRESEDLPVGKLEAIWEKAIAGQWEEPPVWIHGDVAPGNLLVSSGALSGVIDFGIMAVGDPACDYAMAWTFFQGSAKDAFLHGLDEATIDRARGWALWKALVTRHSAEKQAAENAAFTLKRILEE